MSGSGRAGHLRETADQLWTGDHRWALERAGSPAGPGLVEEYLVLPRAQDPRLLLPAGGPAAASVADQLAGDGSLRGRSRRRLMQVGLRTGLARVLSRDRLRVYAEASGSGTGSLVGHLGEVLDRPVAIAMPVTRPRANRKPVLRVVDPAGGTLAFVKVGVNPLTRVLVRREAEVLARLAVRRLDHVVLPTVLAAHSWGALELLVLDPLPIPVSSRPTSELVAAAARELAAVDGVEHAALDGSSFWSGLHGRIQQLGGADGARLREAAQRVVDACGDTTLAFGAWHGDWAPWNVAGSGARLLVWDLERFQQGVPLGLDVVHWDLSTRMLVPGRHPGAVVAERLAAADELLTDAGVGGSDAPVVFVLYLLELSARWLADGQAEAGIGTALVSGLVDATVEAATTLAPGAVGAPLREEEPT